MADMINAQGRRQVVILLAALPGTRRDALLALLRALPEVQIGGVTSTLTELLTLIERWQPDAVVIDESLCASQCCMAAVLVQMVPAARCVAVVDGPAQRDQCLREGAHLAFLRSGLTEQTLRSVFTEHRGQATAA